MKTISLTQGKTALVDDADFDRLNTFKWHANQARPGVWYAKRRVAGRTVYLHREIMGAVSGQMVDHKDCDTMNNRRENLRFATDSQNNANVRKRAGCSSQFKGVQWHRDTQKWMAQVRDGARLVYLGYFLSEEEAGRAYDAAAKQIYGEFAKLNFV